VRILDIVLEKERTAKQAAEKVLEQIDLLKKTILARAFRGEL
jgi:type I restriction enzyme S subunit